MASNDTTGSLAVDDKTALSDYDAESGVSSTQSLSSSILETTFANGRVYHRKSQGQYFQPTDETELDRLDLIHHLLLHIMDGELYTAPIKDRPIHNVLDIARTDDAKSLSQDFGEIHPEAHVIGVDLAPTQPTWVYPNVVFEADDIEKPWLWKQNFDFIFCRTMASSIRDWAGLAQQMFKHTVPGGWVEIVDHGYREFWCDDGSAPAESNIRLYMEKLSASLSAAGLNVDVSSKFFKELLLDAGFVDVKVVQEKMPFGTWPKEKKYKKAGRIAAESARSGFEAYGLAAIIAGGTPEEEAKKICDGAKEVVMSGKEHWYNILYSVSARKPE